MKPKEGTILTVAREAAVKAAEIAEESANLELFFRAIFEHAEKTLARTPEMLPVLKEAGVVDSGGQGLLEVSVVHLMVILEKKSTILHLRKYLPVRQ